MKKEVIKNARGQRLIDGKAAPLPFTEEAEAEAKVEVVKEKPVSRPVKKIKAEEEK
jgi:hypothetical protein